LAGAADDLAQTEVWLQTIEAGAETPVHKHACDEVVVVSRGRGTCTLFGDGADTEEVAFGPDSTLIVPAGCVHQIRNTGDEPIHLVAAFNATPAAVLTPDGQAMALPWS
jgi:mannose-6-phosphate isomerase-like protein (cupin superfamily)